jgi:hypothetical protein
MTKVHYLTARCPQGCETWLHPRAVWPHTNDPERCRRRPWVDDLVDDALISAPVAQDIASILPDQLVSRPRFSTDRLLNPGPDQYLRIGVTAGVVVRSPIAGVRAQRWAVVVTAAERELGIGAIHKALDPEGFAEIEQRLTEEGRLARCPVCGDALTTKGLAQHRARNTPCRWRRAAAEVRSLWGDGWRDPFTVQDAPLKWGDLNGRAAWRRRIHIVPFPAWTAVLLRDGVSDRQLSGRR